jgi:hypothetical protein
VPVTGKDVEHIENIEAGYEVDEGNGDMMDVEETPFTDEMFQQVDVELSDEEAAASEDGEHEIVDSEEGNNA